MRDRVRTLAGRLAPAPLRRAAYGARRTMAYAWNGLRARDGEITYHGVRLRADPALIGPAVARNLLSHDYEHREARMIRTYLEPGDTVLELGAGMGFIGLLCARVVGGANVHSFEANPLMRAVIEGNYALNPGPPPNLNIGLLTAETEGPDEVTFYVPEEFWAASLTPIEGAREVKAPRLSLPAHLGRVRPSFLAMDIEGAEIEVVKALAPGTTLRKIAMEVHPEVTGQDAIEGMVARLRTLGFARRWASHSGSHMYFAAT